MSTKIQIDRLRSLHQKVKNTSATCVEDLRGFLRSDNTFLSTPKEKRRKPSVSSSSTCFMALAQSDKFKELYGEDSLEKTKLAFRKIVNTEWASSGLLSDNVFTQTMVFRATGFLIYHGIIKKKDLSIYKHNTKTLKSLLNSLTRDIKKNTAIKGYPPSIPIAYWMIDAIEKIKFKLTDAKWRNVYQWASSEFKQQLSLVVSGNDAHMDPIALAMAGCLCSKLKRINEKRELETAKLNGLSELIPSQTELIFAVHQLFKFQSESGIWPKYFPMFHYPLAGSNYCFTFEMLEALIREFCENNIFSILDEEILGGLEKAFNWVLNNKIQYRDSAGHLYSGWNSGGDRSSLAKGIPESWATCTVHMFLFELHNALSKQIKIKMLDRYQAKYFPNPNPKKWEEFIDLDVKLHSMGDKTVKRIVKQYIFDPISNSLRRNPVTPINIKIEGKRSLLLFGPPGTSKTALAEAIAAYLGWSLIKLDPSHFLSRNIENIYERANEIFDDLYDLSKVVVLFDEMDGLVQSRESPDLRLDIISRFLTTSMLPKLAKLHDKAKVIFLMATNHIENFDPAIKRPGRFDLLICMSPPSIRNKVDNLNSFLKGSNPIQIEMAKNLFKELIKSPLAKPLEHFTFGEFKSFIEYLIDEDILFVDPTDDILSKINGKIDRWKETVYLNHKEEAGKISSIKKFNGDMQKSQIQ